MRHGSRIDVWIVASLVSVCLAGAGYAVLKLDLGRLNSIPADAPAPVTSVQPATPLPTHEARTPHHKSLLRASSLAHIENSDRKSGRNQIPDPAPEVGRPRENERASTDNLYRSMKPLGYVQKSNGEIEAIVADAGGVHMVREGEENQDKYSVAQVPPPGIDLAAKENRPPVSGNPQTAQNMSLSDAAKAVGYVEKPDGTRMDVLAQGSSVALVPRRAPESVVTSAQVARQTDPTSRSSNGRKNMIQSASLKVRGNFGEPSKPLPIQLTQAGSETVSTRAPVVTAQAIGFVEKADGKVQAIVNDAGGIRLASVPTDEVRELVAQVDSLKPPATGTSPLPPQAETIAVTAGRHSGYEIAREVPPGKMEDQPGEFERTLPDSSLNALATSSKQEYPTLAPKRADDGENLPPQSEVPLAGDQSAPRTPPRDEAAVINSFCDVPGPNESPERATAVLESLGIVGGQNGRASPEIATFEPATPPTGPPDNYVGVASSFGFEDWSYGRAFPSPANRENRERKSGTSPPRSTILQSLGYIQWKDGSILAVINDSHGGVRLVHEGEGLDAGHYLKKVGPDSVEIAERPAARAGSSILPPGIALLPIRPGVARALVLEAMGSLAQSQPTGFMEAAIPGSTGPAPFIAATDGDHAAAPESQSKSIRDQGVGTAPSAGRNPTSPSKSLISPPSSPTSPLPPKSRL